MMKPPLSPAAAALLRALLERAGAERDRMLLVAMRSTEWHSLTFAGERHVLDLRILGPAGETVAARLLDGLDEAEFAIPRQMVADIAAGPPTAHQDGSVTLRIEALTVAD